MTASSPSSATSPSLGSTELSSGALDVVAILVVYERSLDEVASWRRLSSMLAGDRLPSAPRLRLAHLLVYDNSATPRARPAAPEPGCSYVHDRGNGGTAAAYRHGAGLAARQGAGWLLLVDHDTSLPAELFGRASAVLVNVPQLQPAALLPWVVHGSTVVSPARITRAGTIRPLDRHAPLDPAWRLTAIASGCFIRAAAFSALDPMPEGLWLDYVDHWVFAQLSRQAAPIVLIDCVLQHDLSVCNPRQLSSARLQSILQAESCFVAGLPWLARATHPLRLLARAARMATARRDHAVTMLRHTIGLQRDAGP